MYYALYAVANAGKGKQNMELQGLYTEAQLGPAVLKLQKTKALKAAEFYSVEATHHARKAGAKRKTVLHSTNARLNEKLQG